MGGWETAFLILGIGISGVGRFVVLGFACRGGSSYIWVLGGEFIGDDSLL